MGKRPIDSKLVRLDYSLRGENLLFQRKEDLSTNHGCNTYLNTATRVGDIAIIAATFDAAIRPEDLFLPRRDFFHRGCHRQGWHDSRES